MEHTNINNTQHEHQNAAENNYTLRALDISDIKAMLALQDRVGSGDIIKKTEAALTAHFNDGHTALGIEKDGVLVAQTTLKAEAMMPHTATIGFMMTDPAYRGQGLSDMLVTEALAHMGYSGFMVAQARVKIDNASAAWKKFEKHGFSIIGEGESPDQAGRQIYTLQKTLSDDFLMANNIAADQAQKDNTASEAKPHNFAAPSPLL